MASNWAGNIEYLDTQTFHPKSVEELAKLIELSEHVKVRGSKHSFNNIANTTGFGIELEQMPTMIEINEIRKTVRINAGLKYGELAKYLSAKGWALANLASLPHISVAGATATGTHGSGIKNGALHTAINAIEFIDGQGVLQRISEKDLEFYGSVVNLGALGITTYLELKIEPFYEVSQIVFTDLSIENFAENLLEIMTSAYSVSFFTNWEDPLVGNIWSKSRSAAHSTLDFLQPATKKYHPIPSVNPEVCTDQMGVFGAWQDRLPHFKMEFTPSVGEEIQSEFFVSVDDAPQVIELLLSMRNKITPLLYITEIRVIAPDQHWLSPAYERNTIAFHFTWKPVPEIYPVIKEIEEKLSEFNYRPHMGKVFFADAAYLENVYPKWKEFKVLRNKFDPSAKFLNDFLKQILL